MEFTQRIKKVQKYFEQFNIVKDLAYVIMSFPKKWMEYDYKSIGNKNGVVIENRDGKTLFFTDANEDLGKLFDTIDEIILFNEQEELKTELLKKKAQELSAIFATEPIEKLETLTFTFAKKKATKTTKKQKEKQEQTQNDNNGDVLEEKNASNIDNMCEKSELVNFVEEEIIGG